MSVFKQSIFNGMSQGPGVRAAWSLRGGKTASWLGRQRHLLPTERQLPNTAEGPSLHSCSGWVADNVAKNSSTVDLKW